MSSLIRLGSWQKRAEAQIQSLRWLSCSLSPVSFGRLGLRTIEDDRDKGMRLIVGLVERLPKHHPLRRLPEDEFIVTAHGRALIVGRQRGYKRGWFDLDSAIYQTLAYRDEQRALGQIQTAVELMEQIVADLTGDPG